MPAKLTIDEVRKRFAVKGYTLLTTEYKNSRQIFNYICENGHESKMRLDHLAKGVGCSICSGNSKLTIDYVRKSFSKENYVLLETEYANSHTKLLYKCPEGHKHLMSWDNWNRGHRCPKCAGVLKYDIPYIKNSLEKNGYELLSDLYDNKNSMLECICPEGHIYKVSWNNWNNSKSRCSKCGMIGVSTIERNLSGYIKSLGFDVKLNDRSIISPYELDIVIPDKKVAIEYCGLYWHSELMGKDRNYHLNKLKLCEKKGYHLITIFEDEFLNNKEIVFSRINMLLGIKPKNVVFARKCDIKEISDFEARTFCIKNHLQGYGNALIKLGAFYEKKLVSVMTFSTPSLAKGNKIKRKSTWELSRFCSLKDHVVVGIASKFIKYFERKYKPVLVFSYADRRWSTGDLYKVLGFNLVGETKPNYWYFKRNNKRFHRFALRKIYFDDKNKTEWDIRKSYGWNRIWDCGNLKFEYAQS